MITVTNQIIKYEQSVTSEFDDSQNQVQHPTNISNSPPSSSIIHQKIIPLQFWQFGLSLEGQILIVKLKNDLTKALTYKFIEEDDNGTLYYRCLCKSNGSNAVISLLKDDESIIAVESGIHNYNCCPQNYMEIMKEQSKLGRVNQRMMR
uniref:FLYWCH-type domain-containing protein n=1 Tax=Panagrolaimus sp. JU765 TaxID=591449 RepID=A0AC34QYS7_9BILA